MRNTFVETVTTLMEKHTDIVLLLGDIGVFGFRDVLKRFPTRAINIGILEQAMVSAASGWARLGYTPIVHTIAPFLIERAFEQLKVDFGYPELPGIFVGAGGSYDYSSLGCTHHCPADIALLENIPGFTIYTPGNAVELGNAINRAYARKNLAYVRLSERVNTATNPIGFTRFNEPENSAPIPVVVAVGPCLDMVKEATKGLDVCIVYSNVIPGNEFHLPPIASGPIVVVEPWYQTSICQQLRNTPGCQTAEITSVCVPRNFIKSYGKSSDIDSKLEFTAPRLRAIVEPLCKIKN